MKNRLPVWFKQDIPDSTVLKKIQMLSKFKVHTVCQEAKCPNLSYCFKNRKLTFMILGDSCTRNCRFCAVDKSGSGYLAVDKGEPYRIAQIVRMLNLKFVVLTSVTRDDLTDGGAAQFAKTIELIHNIDRDINPVRNTAQIDTNTIVSNGVNIEALVPDFLESPGSLKSVIDTGPSILAHNLETVKRLYEILRPKANYGVSLGLLKKAKEINPYLTTKSSLILGFGEKEGEVVQAMKDLRDSLCDILTLGQYLAPSDRHYPVKEFISIEQFARYRKIAVELGFKNVLSGPKVRSSYQAEEVYANV